MAGAAEQHLQPFAKTPGKDARIESGEERDDRSPQPRRQPGTARRVFSALGFPERAALQLEVPARGGEEGTGDTQARGQRSHSAEHFGEEVHALSLTAMLTIRRLQR